MTPIIYHRTKSFIENNIENLDESINKFIGDRKITSIQYQAVYRPDLKKMIHYAIVAYEQPVGH